MRGQLHGALRRPIASALARLALCGAALAPLSAHASFLSGDALDAFATGLAWFILFVVPIGAIVLFWLVHVMPEKIAHKRHHPQRDAIQTLCLLSLVFGGMLWPLAWLWAYTKPIGYKSAYGTDLHDDYFVEMDERLRVGKLTKDEIEHLRSQLDTIAARRALPPKLRALREALAEAGDEIAHATAGRERV